MSKNFFKKSKQMQVEKSLPRQRLLKFGEYLSACAPEATVYGRCVSDKAEKIGHNACAKEFQVLVDCFKKQVCHLFFIYEFQFYFTG